MSDGTKTLTKLFQCLDAPLDSVSLRRFFLMLFRAHWLDPANHGTLSEYLDCMKYSEDPKERTVDVELSHTYDPEKGAARPSIYVGFTGFILRPIAIGDSIGRLDDNSARREGKRADTLMKVSAIAKSADQALLMTESNATLLQGIHKDIMRSMDILKLEVRGWTDARIMEKAPDRNFQVDLDVAISFNFLVEIDIESHRIKKFGTEIKGTI